MRGVDFAPARERIYSVQLNDRARAAFMRTRFDANKLFMLAYLLIRGSSSPMTGFEPNAMSASLVVKRRAPDRTSDQLSSEQDTVNARKRARRANEPPQQAPVPQSPAAGAWFEGVSAPMLAAMPSTNLNEARLFSHLMDAARKKTH
eukprot:2406211-Amphidinium_carterae.2